MDNPSGSRCYVVCGKAAEAEVLRAAFEAYGNVQNVTTHPSSGVAYVKFDKASSAAIAVENLHGAVLNNGRGPQLKKVLIADPPNARSDPQTRRQQELDLARHPDNRPPRSRLFLVVPKTADGHAIKNELTKFEGFDYCRVDLIQRKSVMFVKFVKSSSAIICLEEVNKTRVLAGYEVTCEVARPRPRRWQPQQFMPQMDFNMGGLLNKPHTAQHIPGLGLGGVGSLASMANTNMGSLSSFSGLGKLDSPHSHQGAVSGLGSLGGIGLGAPGNSLGCMGLNTHAVAPMVESHRGLSSGDISSYTAVDSNLSPTGPAPPLSKQRLYVVVNKAVTQDELVRLFRRFPGMEYCDLKKDKKTGKSKGQCYVNYSSPEAAASAVQQLDQTIFPPRSGHRITVKFSEVLVPKRNHETSLPAISYPAHTYETTRHLKNYSQTSYGAVLEECEGPVVNGNPQSLADDSHDDCKVFIGLTRPMPDYSLRNVFSRCGKVEYVQLQQGDGRVGVVKFTTPEAAQDAVCMLNGADVLGETLNVSTSASQVVSAGEQPAKVAGPIA